MGSRVAQRGSSGTGELFEAERLLPLGATIHVVTSMGMAGLDAAFDMMDELIDTGLTANRPFTAGPRPTEFGPIGRRPTRSDGRRHRVLPFGFPSDSGASAPREQLLQLPSRR